MTGSAFRRSPPEGQAVALLKKHWRDISSPRAHFEAIARFLLERTRFCRFLNAFMLDGRNFNFYNLY
jgi:hypothetical protein